MLRKQKVRTKRKRKNRLKTIKLFFLFKNKARYLLVPGFLIPLHYEFPKEKHQNTIIQ